MKGNMVNGEVANGPNDVELAMSYAGEQEGQRGIGIVAEGVQHEGAIKTTNAAMQNGLKQLVNEDIANTHDNGSGKRTTNNGKQIQIYVCRINNF